MLITDKKQLLDYTADKRLWQGIPSVEVTKGGRTFVAFYSGGIAEQIGNYVVLIKSDNDGDFSEPIAVCYENGQRCFDPSLWIDPLGRLWMIWARLPAMGVFASICDEPDAEELMWTEPFCITDRAVVMMNKPTVLSSGEWLFPTALWKREYLRIFNAVVSDDMVTGSFVHKSSDNGRSFVHLGTAHVPGVDFDEHMILEKRDGTLAMYVRTSYGIGVSHSYDRGRTWTQGRDSGIKGPCSRFFIRRLRSGRVLLVNHYDFDGRNNLHALLSDDDGETFPHKLLLDERNVSYPDCAEDNDGNITVVYDRGRGCNHKSLEESYRNPREIVLARITEEDIINGKLVSDGSYLKRVANGLGKYYDEEGSAQIYRRGDRFSVYEGYTDRQAASAMLSFLPKDKIMAFVFEVYKVPCSKVNNIDVKRLDSLAERLERGEAADEDVLAEIISIVKGGRSDYEDSPTVARVKELIGSSNTLFLSVGEIAKRVGISRYYLQHIFKRETGITMTAYIRERKLSEAKRLLITTEKQISDIAYECGYLDAGYFTKVFGESEGVTPTEYRKMNTRK